MKKRYQSDLSEEEWAIILPMVPACKPGGRPRRVNIRHIMNAIFYLLKTGCQWRMLPQDFPPCGTTVHYYFRRWRLEGVWFKIHEQLRSVARKKHQKDEHPTAGIMDSQSVKTTEKRSSMDMTGGKKVKGRKRHILVDTLEFVLSLIVLPADISDRKGAFYLLGGKQLFLPLLKYIFADGGYEGEEFIGNIKQQTGWTLKIVKRTNKHGFTPLAKRWIVERTFA